MALSTDAPEVSPPDLSAEPPGLSLPLGRRLELPGRGTTFIREVAQPHEGAPTVLLVHGWIASGGLNWFNLFEPLGEHFGVIAPDLRGHGRGLRNGEKFHLTDCADDLAATLEILDTGPVIVAGYSMGGPISQLLWKRHPHLVSGLVLCATSHRFVKGMRDRMVFTTAMAAAAGTTKGAQSVASLPRSLARQWLPSREPNRPESMRRWARAEMRRHDWRMLMEAGGSIGRYNAKKWIDRIDVPTAVVVTTADRAIVPSEQGAMAFKIPGATIFRVDDGHVACAGPKLAGPFVEACLDVAERGRTGN